MSRRRTDQWGNCRFCHKLVLWATSAASGKPMPVQVDEENGNVAIDDQGRAHVFADHDKALEAINGDERDDLPLGETWLSHHVDPGCPHPYRKQKAEPKPPSPQASFDV